MSKEKRKAVHYINQFYGQIGGEDMADVRFSVTPGPVGPGKQLQAYLEGEVEIVATIICGDNYFSTNLEAASEELITLVGGYSPDVFFSGPAFGAGRYGLSAGHAAKVVGEKFNIPVISGMFEENPGLDLYRTFAYIAKTHNSAAKMRDDLKTMANIAIHLLNNSHGHLFVDGYGIGTPEEENYFPRDKIRNIYTRDLAAKRSVNMLLDKIAGRPFKTEMTYVSFEKSEPATPVLDITKSRVAIVSDGALVDKDNILKLKSRGSNVWGTYPLREFMSPEKTASDYKVSHTGYFHMDVIEDRNRIVPFDILSEMEASHDIGELADTYYVTSGNCNADKWNVRMGQEMALRLKNDGVDAVILTST